MSRPIDDIRRKLLEAAFWMPSVQTMVSRKSSITNAFVNAVIPVVAPCIEEIDEALNILAIDPSDLRCAYCGDKATEWDHLRPLVLKHRPTGYISEIANLVPSCGKCNQCKGNSQWQSWMRSPTARHSPTKRAIADLEARITRLAKYENWKSPTQIDFEQLLGAEDWQAYWKLWEVLIAEMRKCQEVADALRQRIAVAIAKA